MIISTHDYDKKKRKVDEDPKTISTHSIIKAIRNKIESVKAEVKPIENPIDLSTQVKPKTRVYRRKKDIEKESEVV